MNEVAKRMDCSKSWIVREAVSHWLAEEQRRYELTLEDLREFDERRTIGRVEMLDWVELKKT